MFLINGIIFYCKPNLQQNEGEVKDATAIAMAVSQAEEAALRHIGDPQKKPNLKILELEFGWLFYPAGYGVRMPNHFQIYERNGKMYFKYACPYANVSDTLSTAEYPFGNANDFTVDRKIDGIIDSNYSTTNYLFPSMLSIKIFKNGQKLFATKKQEFWFANTGIKEGYEFNRHWYRGDTMFISSGCADLYINSVRLPGVGVADPGKYVVVIKANPDRIITECDGCYDDNVATLPFRIEDNLPFLDLTALEENKPAAPRSLTAIKKLTGNPKTVSLFWNNANDSIPDIDDEFEVWENGAFKKTVYGGVYIQTVAGSWKQSSFDIYYKVDGLGKSNKISITVKK